MRKNHYLDVLRPDETPPGVLLFCAARTVARTRQYLRARHLSNQQLGACGIVSTFLHFSHLTPGRNHEISKLT